MIDVIGLFIVLAFLIVYILIGFFTSKTAARSLRDYLIAGGGLRASIVGLAFASTYMSASSFMGSLGAAYSFGYALNSILDTGLPLIFLIFAMVLAPILRRSGVITVPGFFEQRYGLKMKVLTALITVVMMYVYAIAQIKAIGIAMEYLLGVSYMIGVLTALAIIIYIILGGMYATIWNNVIMTALMLIVGYLVSIIAISIAGPNNIVYSVIEKAPYYYSLSGKVGLSFIWTFGFTYLLGTMAMPHVLMTVFTTADESTARKAVVIGTIAIAALYTVLFIVPASVIALAVPTKGGDYILMDFISKRGFQPLPGLVVAGIIAAAMSSIAVQLMTAGSAVIYDLYLKFIRRGREIPEKQAIRLLKATMLVIGILALITAISPPALIVIIVGLAMGIAAVSFFVPLYGGVIWKSATESSALASSLSGFITFVLLHPQALGGITGLAVSPPFMATVYGVIVSAIFFVCFGLAKRVKK